MNYFDYEKMEMVDEEIESVDEFFNSCHIDLCNYGDDYKDNIKLSLQLKHLI